MVRVGLGNFFSALLEEKRFLPSIMPPCFHQRLRASHREIDPLSGPPFRDAPFYLLRRMSTHPPSQQNCSQAFRVFFSAPLPLTLTPPPTPFFWPNTPFFPFPRRFLLTGIRRYPSPFQKIPSQERLQERPFINHNSLRLLFQKPTLPQSRLSPEDLLTYLLRISFCFRESSPLS